MIKFNNKIMIYFKKYNVFPLMIKNNYIKN